MAEGLEPPSKHGCMSSVHCRQGPCGGPLPPPWGPTKTSKRFIVSEFNSASWEAKDRKCQTYKHMANKFCIY